MSKQNNLKTIWRPLFPGSKIKCKALIVPGLEMRPSNLKIGETKQYDGYSITRFQ